MTPEQTLFVVPEHQGVATRARKVVLDPSTLDVRIPRADQALAVVGMAFCRLDLFPADALADAVHQTQPPDIAEESMKIIAAVMSEESDVV
jgi:hypothetical protein